MNRKDKQEGDYEGSIWTDPVITQRIVEIQEKIRKLEVSIKVLEEMIKDRDKIVYQMRHNLETQLMNKTSLKQFLDFQHEVREDLKKIGVSSGEQFVEPDGIVPSEVLDAYLQ